MSVLGQSYPKLEFIIIDGKSSDRTLSIIEEYSSEISDVISEKDDGIYDAMNKGIDKASGAITIFLNAGDKFYSNNVLNSINNTINSLSTEFGVIYGSTLFHYPFGIYIVKPDKPSKLKYCMPFCHQSVFIKTELLKRYKFNTQLRITGDHDQLLRLYNDFPDKFIEFDNIISEYDATNGISSKQIFRSYKEEKSFSTSPDSFFRKFRMILRALVPSSILKPLVRFYFRFNNRYTLLK